MAGETLTAPTNSSVLFYDTTTSGMYAVEFNLTFGTTDNELNDIAQAGYIGINATPFFVGWYPTDMDTNGSPAAVHKVTVGGVDIVTGLNGAQTGTAQLVPVSTFVTTSANPTLVQVQTTTAAATAAAGTAKLVLFCQKKN